VSQHGAESNIANAPDVRSLGAVFGIDNDATTLIYLKAGVLEAETGGEGAAADGDKYNIGVELST